MPVLDYVYFQLQWMTWQQQMSDQRKDFESSLSDVLNRIHDLEQKKMAQNTSNTMQMHDTGPGYPKGGPNQNFFTPQNQPNPRFSHENHAFHRNYPENSFQQQNRPRFPPNNPNLRGPNEGFSQRMPGQANHLRPPQSGPAQNRPDLNRPNNNTTARSDHWQKDQYHNSSGDYAENDWDDNYQDNGGYGNDNYHDESRV